MTSTAFEGQWRTKRIGVPDEIRSRTSLTHIDYQDALVVGTRDASSDNAEQWIRRMFESAPTPLRAFIRFGWLMCGAKLGPYPAPDYVVGWRIGENEPDLIRIDVEWRVGLRAQLVLHTQPSSIVFATFVAHHRRAARILWPVLVPVHKMTVRYLIARAARTRAIGIRPFVVKFQRYVVNPLFRHLGPHIPGWAVVETTGRRSGLPRQTPVGGRIEGSTFWMVSEYGRLADYVRNIDANPNVRLRIKGKWRTGTATILDDDDPGERLRRLPRANSVLVRMVGTRLLTLRIDLEPLP